MIYSQSQFRFTDLFLSYQPMLQAEWEADKDWNSFRQFNAICSGMSHDVKYPQTPDWRIGALYNFGKQYVYQRFVERFPKAWELASSIGNAELWGSAGYSVILPGGKINPHIDFDNDGSLIRVQIPIYIPPGDTGLEVESLTARHNAHDLMIFDHSKMHSAWNNTTEARVVFIIDLPKKLGLIDHFE